MQRGTPRESDTASRREEACLLNPCECSCTVGHITACYSRHSSHTRTFWAQVGSRENSSHHPVCTAHLNTFCVVSHSCKSGVASFVDFFSSLALLAVMLSLFSVFWRRFLQLYLVVVYCSEVRLLCLQRHYATSWSLVRGGCSGSSAL